MNASSHRSQPTGNQLLKVELVNDFDAIKKIYEDPYTKRAAHDNRPHEPIEHPDVYYFGAYIDAELVGVFIMIDSNFIDVDVHSLLTRKAMRHCRELGQLCIDLIFSNPDIHRLTGWIMEGLESALNYDLKIGFKYEGFKEKSVMKNGKLIGVHMVGLTRDDWVNK